MPPMGIITLYKKQKTEEKMKILDKIESS